MLLAMVTAFSVIPIQNVFAATGDAAVITFSYTYDSNGNAMHYNSGAVINGYTAGGRESINIGCLLTAILAFVSSPVFRCIQGTP